MKNLEHFTPQYKNYNYMFHFLFYFCSVEQVENISVLKLPWNVFLAGITEGKSRMTDCLTGKEYVLKKDCWWFIPKNRKIFYEMHYEQKILNIQFALEIYPGVDLFEHDKTIHTGKDPELIEKLQAEMKTESVFSMLKIRAMMTSLVARMKPEQTKLQWIFHPFTKKLQPFLENPHATDSVKTIAYEMQMTPEAFSRKFHQIFGCSPKQYFDKILMTRAIAHLRSDKSCAEIASLLRFSSESHFFRFINRMTGKKVKNLRQERNLNF